MLSLYPAKSVITMNPSMPRADAVLVRGDRIVEVGSRRQMQPWLDHHPHQIDDRFSDCFICPGFIDPHLHPAMAAVLLPMKFVTAMRWKLPWGTVEPTVTPQDFDDRMRALAASQPPEEPLFIWGYHQLWHGEMSRERINQATGSQPTIVWHRSFHELYMNDAALSLTGLAEQQNREGQQINWRTGHFFENGLSLAIKHLNRWILEPQRFAAGLERLKQVVHFGGQTTIGDMAVGLFNFDNEFQAMRQILDTQDTPFRTRMVAHGAVLAAKAGSHDKAARLAAALPDKNTHRLQFGKHIKLFSDGAFFSQLAQLQEPGYIDGHHGEWLTTPENLEAAVRAYWNEGFQIHVHVTGDLGLELTLDILEKMQFERPRFNHNFTFEHFGFSTPEQIRRIKALGAQVSANVYYLHELSDMYANQGIGFERASQMARVGACFAQDINTTFHSDFTMAPAEPLNSAWVAVNRVNHAGMVMCKEERLTAQQALQAITINAAHVLGMANETGSLRAGKYADFTVLKEDPLTCDPTTLNELEIKATVFEGRVFPI